MSDKNYIIRTMNRKEVDIAIDWAATEGWNPGINDADSFYPTDPDGFFIGLLGNKPIATISAVKYGKSFGFMGFYIVKPEYRGKDYGIAIWNAGIKYLGNRNIGLDSVVSQQDTYKKSGFKLAYRNIRFEGKSIAQPIENSEIVKLSTLPFETVDLYDRPFFPENRSQFIKLWIKQHSCNALGIMRNKKLAGYGVIRKCLSGYKIGPLIADDPELAEHLFLALQTGVLPSEPIYLDTPEVNQQATELARRKNMKVVFETARMYTGTFPDMPLNRLFGVTSFELG